MSAYHHIYSADRILPTPGLVYVNWAAQKPQKGRGLAITVLDLSTAFDTIDHIILLDKLWHYGIRGLAHQWFNSYLTKRKQLVYINKIHSNIQTVEYGVPQRSILGPLLFLIYVNDFPNCITSGESIMYADDTNIFLKHKSYEKLYLEANQQLSNIAKWLNCNKLTPNIKKTFYIVFRRPKTIPPPNSFTLSFKNNCITRKSEANFLGVILNS